MNRRRSLRRFAALGMAIAVIACGVLLVRGREPAKPSPASSAPAAVERLPSPSPVRELPAADPSLPRGCTELCACCRSGRSCGPDGCDTPIGASERFRLRAELPAVARDPAARPVVKLCAGAPKHCIDLTHGDRALSLEIEARSLGEQGLELSFQLPVATDTGVFRTPLSFSETLRFENLERSALCTGLTPELVRVPLTSLRLYLDPATGQAPPRCPAAR